MNLERRLQDAFTHRTETVEPSPGAFFEIQRRLSRTRRAPELRLRPALVLAAAACALTIALVVTLTGTDAVPDGQIVTPLAPSTDPPAPTATTPPATAPTPTPPGTPTPPVAPDPSSPGEIATVAPPPPTVAPPAAVSPPVPPPQPSPAGTGVEQAAPEQPDLAEGTVAVTVHFACGDDDAAPRLRAAPANDLATALSTLVAGPNEADAEAGCQGLSPSGQALAAVPSRADKWVTVDLSGNLAGALESITAAQFLAQLNSTVFEFDDVAVAEYRLDGNCAAFGELLGRSCEVHTRGDTGSVSHVSELTSQTIGQSAPVIRSQADDGAAELGVLSARTRLTDRRATGTTTTWTQVITTGGQIGWVPTTTLAAQPLAITPEATRAMEDLARRLTTGPNLQAVEFSPAGLVVRWGAGSDEVTLIDTAGAEGDWWYEARDIPSPRDAEPTASLAELFWIDGSSDSAEVTINLPGRLGEPHSDFSSLAYVSIYQAAVGDSILPPELEAVPGPVPSDPEPGGGTTEDGVELPPPLPVETDTNQDESGGTPESSAQARSQVKVSVMFDFVSRNEPRIVAVEAIWDPLA